MGSCTSFPVAGDVGPGAVSGASTEGQLPVALVEGGGQCDTSWVTAGGGQQTTGSGGNLRLSCQSTSVSGVVSGVKLKVRPSQSMFTPTWPWVPSISVAGTQGPT